MPVPTLLQTSSATRGGVASVSGRATIAGVSSAALRAPRRPSVLARGHAHPDRALLPDVSEARSAYVIEH
jgi:hypothetical protein